MNKCFFVNIEFLCTVVCAQFEYFVDFSVLFDTGFHEDTVIHNAQLLKKDLSKVEKVVLSHFHSDHTGGLLKLRKKYKKVKWKKPMNGPWIHQNILETIQNIKSKKIITGGTKVNESDGYCAALPYFLFNDRDKELKEVIKSVANSRINEKYALSKLKIIELANKKNRNPVQSFVKKYKKNKYFKDVISNIKKVIRLKNQNHIKTVRKFGKACSYPGTFMGSIHAIITSNSYKSAITKTIKAGGCNCSRANFVGAYFAALKPESIPSHWVRRTLPAKNILKYINS